MVMFFSGLEMVKLVFLCTLLAVIIIWTIFRGFLRQFFGNVLDRLVQNTWVAQATQETR
jgi:hypothetical protein